MVRVSERIAATTYRAVLAKMPQFLRAEYIYYSEETAGYLHFRELNLYYIVNSLFACLEYIHTDVRAY